MDEVEKMKTQMGELEDALDAAALDRDQVVAEAEATATRLATANLLVGNLSAAGVRIPARGARKQTDQ